MSHLVQGSPEWKEMRRKHIGGSDAPVIMGVSPWKTKYQLWLEKLSKNQEEKLTVPMIRGREREEEARCLFNSLTGFQMVPKVTFCPSYSFIMASMDGFDEIEQEGLEIKCPGKVDHEKAMDGQIPEKYYPQLQHTMITTGLKQIYYFSYQSKDSCKVIVVEKDEAYCNKLIAEEKTFWKHVLELDPPCLSDRDYLGREDDEWLETAKNWMDIQSQIKELEKKADGYRNNLIALADNANSSGGGIRLSKFFRKGSVDYARVPELKGVNLEQYRKSPSEYWRIDLQ